MRFSTRQPAASVPRKAKTRQSWVYVIDNPSMPEMIKVGYTSRHPKERLSDSDYSVGTAMPTHYRIAFAVRVDQAQRVERDVHQRLPGRVTQPGAKGNEWFRSQPSQAISLITETANKQRLPIQEYYNPRKMDIRHLPPPTKGREPARFAWVVWGTVTAALLGLAWWLVWPVAAPDWPALGQALAWLVWEVLTWLVWLTWWLAWLVWEVLTWLASSS